LSFSAVVGVLIGRQGGEEYLSAYLLEYTLSADNLMVFLLVFRELSIPAGQQRRVLFWGISGAIVTRGLFIALGVDVLHHWHSVIYALGGLLVILGLRLLKSDAASTEEPSVLRFLRAHAPFAQTEAAHFFVREHGRLKMTRLAVALVTIELCDITFAVDSIPSAFAMTRSPFVLYASNMFAVLGLRSLFALLSVALARLHYLQYGLAAVLVFAGAKMLASYWMKISPLVSLAFIVACLALTTIASRPFAAPPS
jgi:tellurite resistance protein TerC